MLGPSVESNVGFDHRVCRVEIVDSNLKTHLIALSTDYSFVAKQNLDASRTRLGQARVEEREKKRVKHHGPHHLGIHCNLQARALFEERIATVGQCISLQEDW